MDSRSAGGVHPGRQTESVEIVLAVERDHHLGPLAKQSSPRESRAICHDHAMTYFTKYREPDAGFATIAGRDTGLRRIVLAAGRLGAGQGGPIHLHHGEEILRILTGEVEVTVGNEQCRCRAGDVVIIPTDTTHGFTTLTDTTMEVVAELDAGQVFPVPAEDGGTRLTEVYRKNLPWSRQPPQGFDWTSDSEMDYLLRRIADAAGDRR